MGNSRPDPRPVNEAPAVRAAAAPARARSARHTLLFGMREHKAKLWWLVGVVLLGLVALGLIWRYTDLTLGDLTTWIDAQSALAVIPIMALLPIAGFPISVVYLVAGARFGPGWGGVVVAGVTAVHLIGSYVIARSFLRAPLQRFIEKRHAHLPQIPDDEQAAVCLIAALIPGLPYVVRNYILALAGVKFRYYFWVCLPVYVARSYVTILLGDMTSDPTRSKIIILVVVDILKVAICALVIWRLRKHHQKYHGHDSPETAVQSDPVAPPTAATK
jgi:uncharacterized membrane protein YdjX (TVP38/TMEM64 family)